MKIPISVPWSNGHSSETDTLSQIVHLSVWLLLTARLIEWDLARWSEAFWWQRQDSNSRIRRSWCRHVCTWAARAATTDSWLIGRPRTIYMSFGGMASYPKGSRSCLSATCSAGMYRDWILFFSCQLTRGQERKRVQTFQTSVSGLHKCKFTQASNFFISLEIRLGKIYFIIIPVWDNLCLKKHFFFIYSIISLDINIYVFFHFYNIQ